MKLTKQQFINEVRGSLDDVRDYQDCIDWWNSLIDAYLEDELIPQNARGWKNPFLKQFEE